MKHIIYGRAFCLVSPFLLISLCHSLCAQEGRPDWKGKPVHGFHFPPRGDHVDSVSVSGFPSREVSTEQFPYTDLRAQHTDLDVFSCVPFWDPREDTAQQHWNESYLIMNSGSGSLLILMYPKALSWWRTYSRYSTNYCWRRERRSAWMHTCLRQKGVRNVGHLCSIPGSAAALGKVLNFSLLQFCPPGWVILGSWIVPSPSTLFPQK